MKNKKKVVIVVLLALSVITIIFGVWFLMPRTFLKHVDSKDVKKIEIFSGSTGDKFVVEDEEEIEYIVKNIQSTTMKREKLSVGYVGFSFSLKFKNENDDTISSFILNGESTIRKDPFFYEAKNGELCFGYISELHDKVRKEENITEKVEITLQPPNKTILLKEEQKTEILSLLDKIQDLKEVQENFSNGQSVFVKLIETDGKEYEICILGSYILMDDIWYEADAAVCEEINKFANDLLKQQEIEE